MIEFQVVETGQVEKIKGEAKKQKVSKANHKLRSQNYHFARDQTANEVLKSATSFNEPRKKI